MHLQDSNHRSSPSRNALNDDAWVETWSSTDATLHAETSSSFKSQTGDSEYSEFGLVSSENALRCLHTPRPVIDRRRLRQSSNGVSDLSRPSSRAGSTRSLASQTSFRSVHGEESSDNSLRSSRNSRCSFLQASMHSLGDLSCDPSFLKDRVDVADEKLNNIVQEHFVALVSPSEVIEGHVVGEGSFGRVILVRQLQLRSKTFHRRSCLKKTRKRSSGDEAEAVSPSNATSVEDESDPNVEGRLLRVPSSNSMASASIRGLRRTQSFVSLKIDQNRKSLVDNNEFSFIGSSRKAVSDDPITSSSEDDTSSFEDDEEEDANLRDAHYRKQYVIKKCKRCKNYEAEIEASIDISEEACLLATLNHRNITKLYAISTHRVLSRNFFVMLEHLPITLLEKWEKWKQEDVQSTLFPRFFLSAHKKKDSLCRLIRRLRVAEGVACACEYLHSKNILYRDIKRDNVGFNADGTVKIFDFGLARQLDTPINEDETFLMTRVGAPRYMAPEVIRGLPYNGKADVYSFSILLWELCRLRDAYDGVSREIHFRNITKHGTRPDCCYWWPKKLKNLLRQAWHEDLHQRSNFEIIIDALVKVD